MFAAIRAPTAATSTGGSADPSAVRVASVTSPPYVAAPLLERLRLRSGSTGASARLTCAESGGGRGGESRSRHGGEWCRVGASGLLCRPVGSQGPSGSLEGPQEDRCRG